MTATFQDRVVVITGAASGIGAATARRFAELGATLSLADRATDALEDLAADLRAAGWGDPATLTVDVAVESEVTSLIEQTVARFGRLDVLVNNAGIGHYGHITDTTTEAWRRVMAVDLDSVFFACRAAIPHLAATGGNVVTTCSISGLYADPGLAVYATAKGAVANLTRNLAVDHARQGVRVNAVCPGGVRTPMLQSVLDRWPEEYERLVPMGRPAEPHEIASAITFLASPEASYITGINLVVDGGVTAKTGQPDFDMLFSRARAERAAATERD